MTREQNSRPPTAKAERLSKALRENLKRRKAQLRGRGAAEKAEETRREKSAAPRKE